MLDELGTRLREERPKEQGVDDKLDADRPTKPECIGREHPGIASERPDKPVMLGKEM